MKDRYDIFMDMNKKRQVWRFFAGCFIAILLTLGTAVYVGIIEVCAGKISAGNIWGLVQGAVYNPRYIAMFGMILLIVVSGKWKTALLLIYQHRFLFAGLIFVICILLEINGSSIGMWSLIFGEADPGILAGASRSYGRMNGLFRLLWPFPNIMMQQGLFLTSVTWSEERRQMYFWNTDSQ